MSHEAVGHESWCCKRLTVEFNRRQEISLEPGCSRLGCDKAPQEKTPDESLVRARPTELHVNSVSTRSSRTLGRIRHTTLAAHL